jgi:hypothetical protein
MGVATAAAVVSTLTAPTGLRPLRGHHPHPALRATFPHQGGRLSSGRRTGMFGPERS